MASKFAEGIEMESQASIQIPLNRSRLRTLVYICALVVAFSAYWVLTGHRSSATAISITGALALVAVIVGLKKVGKETTGLIIDGAGITNFSSDVGSFEVGWDHTQNSRRFGSIKALIS